MKPMLWTTLFVFGSALWTAGVAAERALPRGPITSADALAEYLRDAKTSGSPLDAMPVGARRRFLASLMFGSEGAFTFSPYDLDDTLTKPQIREVLALFGLEKYGESMDGTAARRTPRTFESDFELRYDVFVASLDQVPRAGANPRIAAYLVLLDGNDPVKLTETLDHYDRLLLYRAMIWALEEDAVPALPEQVREVLSILHGHGEASSRHVLALFDGLVELRQFELAESLSTSYPKSGLPVLPARVFGDLAEPADNMVLQVSADGRKLSRSALDLEEGLHIVVVAGCHFAENAVTAISADPALDRLFREHATWLAPQTESIVAAAEWNRKFPSHPIRIAWRERNWPQLRSWAMPTFHVFKDGKLLGHWIGWSAESGHATALAELRKHGLLD